MHFPPYHETYACTFSRRPSYRSPLPCPLQVETWTAESAETMELPDKEEQQMAAAPDDAFTRLEQGESDKRKARDLNVRVAELYHDSNLKYKNDYQMNKLLRRNNRSASETSVPVTARSARCCDHCNEQQRRHCDIYLLGERLCTA